MTVMDLGPLTVALQAPPKDSYGQLNLECCNKNTTFSYFWLKASQCFTIALVSNQYLNSYCIMVFQKYLLGCSIINNNCLLSSSQFWFMTTVFRVLIKGTQKWLAIPFFRGLLGLCSLPMTAQAGSTHRRPSDESNSRPLAPHSSSYPASYFQHH